MFSWNVLANVLPPPPIPSRSWGQEQSSTYAGLERDHTDTQGAGHILGIPYLPWGGTPVGRAQTPLFSDSTSPASAGTKP